MSAFVVSREHVAALLNYAHFHNLGGSVGSGEGAVVGPAHACQADMLYAQNERSVAALYGLPIETHPPFTVTEIVAARGLICSHAAFVKAAHCLRYQSCETDDYQGSPAWALLREWCYAAMEEITQTLQVYQDAPWALANFPAGGAWGAHVKLSKKKKKGTNP